MTHGRRKDHEHGLAARLRFAAGRVAVPAMLILAVVTALWFGFLRPRRLQRRQAKNHILCQWYTDHLQNYYAALGEYPERLVRAVPPGDRTARVPVDIWGYPLHYETDGETFLLVSHGKDGLGDGCDYAALQELTSPPTSICGDPEADVVVSSNGWHRFCDK